MSDLATKLQLKPGQGIELVPPSVEPGPALGELAGAGGDVPPALVVCVVDRAELESHLARVVDSAVAGRLTWVAYPKAGGLGTDLNRDSLAEVVRAAGGRPVRQVAIDAVWSALRFRGA